MSILINLSAPDFELPDLRGQVHRLREYRGKIVILNFWSCECPHCERTDGDIMAMLGGWRGKAVMLSVAANRNESLEAVKKAAVARCLPIVLIDADHRLADIYEAQTTPHIFVIDREGILRYRGAVDDVTFRRRTPSRFFLEEVVDALLAGRNPPVEDSPAYGCAIVREI
jgi:peroxiredoxin